VATPRDAWTDSLTRVIEYLSDNADADCDEGGYSPNGAMRCLGDAEIVEEEVGKLLRQRDEVADFLRDLATDELDRVSPGVRLKAEALAKAMGVTFQEPDPQVIERLKASLTRLEQELR
jgi:hypothetical protein